MANGWSFHEALVKTPVCPGEVWRIGPHLVACGDVQRGEGGKFLTWLPGPSHIFYCDPPYNAGIARTFRAQSKVAGGEADFEMLMRQIIFLAAAATREVYIEMGYHHQDKMSGWLLERGLFVVDSWKISYAGGKMPTARLFQANKTRVQTGVGSAEGMDDSETPGWAMRRSMTMPGEVVFDPCLGLGTTLLAAEQNNMRCYGMELNPGRLATALQRLERVTHHKAERVGTF